MLDISFSFLHDHVNDLNALLTLLLRSSLDCSDYTVNPSSGISDLQRAIANFPPDRHRISDSAYNTVG